MSVSSETPAPLRDVAPAQPLAAYLGGKKLLARRIAARIETIAHECYAEPFVGMGGVFLRRRRRPKSEIVNDRNADIVNLFRVVREHPGELVRQFRWALASRQEFARLLAVPPATLTDVQRAARFLYLQRQSFKGKPPHTSTQGDFATSVWGPARLTRARLEQVIGAVHRRLEGVQIECLDWAAFLARYDRPHTLFYLDPPYFGFERDYGRGVFSREDFARMAELLARLKGRFILSLNDRPEVRALFAGFALEEVTVRYTANMPHARSAGELLIFGGGVKGV